MASKIKAKMITAGVTSFIADHPIISAVAGIGALALGLFAIYELFSKGSSSSLANNPQQQGGQQTITPTITPTSMPTITPTANPEVYQNPATNPSGFGVSAGLVGGNLTNEPAFSYSYNSTSNENINEQSLNYAPVITRTKTTSLNYAPSLQYNPVNSLSTSGIASGIGTTSYGKNGGSNFLNMLTDGTIGAQSLYNGITKNFSSVSDFLEPSNSANIEPSNSATTSTTTSTTAAKPETSTTTSTPKASNTMLTGLNNIFNAFK